MSQTHKPQVDIEEEIMTAIDLCGSEGASLDDIQRHLQSTLKNNVPDLESIQSSLNNAVTKGLLLKLESGKYKIKSATERAEKDDEEEEDENEEEEQDEEDDDDEYEVEIMTAIDLCGPEGASLDDIQQYLKSTLKNNVPDLESIQSNLNNAVAKEFLLELDNGKYKIKYYAEPEEEEADDDEEDENDDDDEDENDDDDDDDDEYEVEIMTAIDLCGPEGASLDDIQQYLKSTLKNNVPDLESIQSNLNNAVAKEFLLELDNGKYKIKYYAEPEEEEDDDDEEEENDDDDEEDENDNDDDDDEDYAEYGEDEENAQEVERSVDKVSKDANRNADSDTGNADSSKAEEDANV